MTEFRSHSYIRRRGRLTKAQARALQEYVPSYSIAAEDIVTTVDGNPLGLEIGFGMGHALLRWAADAPDWRLIGIELYQPGIGALTDGLHREGLDNVRVVERPAQEVVACLPDQSVDEIRIFFPDPWPKKRHHKRRLIQAPFVADVARVLKPGGSVRVATDWAPYAAWIREVFAGCDAFTCVTDGKRAAADESHFNLLRGQTNFERRGERLGHDINDFEYRRI